MPLDQIDVDKLPESGAEMSFLEHLEVLRWHIIRSAGAVLAITIVVFLSKDFVFNGIILAPKQADFFTYNLLCSISEITCMRAPSFDLETKELGELFITHLKASIFIGIIASFPYIIYEIWKFVKPGLYENEAKGTKGVVFVCSFLFILGVLFGYYVIAPFAITFLAGYQIGADVVTAPTLASYVNYMVMFTLPTGLTFEMPIIIYFLSKLGIVGPTFLKTYRRHAFVLILIMAAIVTPPDVITQFLITLPLYFLYEVSIVISKRVTTAKLKEA